MTNTDALLNALTAIRTPARAASPNLCGACGNTFADPGDVYSHDCDALPTRVTAADPIRVAVAVGAGTPRARTAIIDAERHDPVPVTGTVEEWLRGLGRKVEPADMTPALIAAARTWLAAYTGTFAYLVELKSQTRGISAGQAKGVLNCWRADLLRAPAAPAAEGPAVADVPAWLRTLGRKVELTDMNAGLVAAAERWLARELDPAQIRMDYLAEMWQRVEDGHHLSPAQAKGVLNCWRADLTRAATPTSTQVPEGRYAVECADGHVAFYRVTRKGYVNLLVGSVGEFDEQWLSRAEQDRVRTVIAADPAAAALRFSRKFTVCARCLSPLSLVQSRATGFGSHCADKLGVRYLPRAEALKVLDEEGIPTDGLEDL